MIRHLVLFKLKAGIRAEDARLATIEQLMEEFPAKIPLIREWHFGRNLTPDAEAWDYGLMASFDSLADLHAYFDHPEHLPVLALWNEVAELAFVDYAV